VEDLAAIVMVMFVAWIASVIALAALIFLAPATWSRRLRVILLLVTAAVFTLLTAALFGSRMAVVATAAGAAAGLLVYFAIRSSRKS
jgi:hypothetical protein